jgi:hypothetical protein
MDGKKKNGKKEVLSNISVFLVLSKHEMDKYRKILPIVAYI